MSLGHNTEHVVSVLHRHRGEGYWRTGMAIAYNFCNTVHKTTVHPAYPTSTTPKQEPKRTTKGRSSRVLSSQRGGAPREVRQVRVEHLGIIFRSGSSPLAWKLAASKLGCRETVGAERRRVWLAGAEDGDRAPNVLVCRQQRGGRVEVRQQVKIPRRGSEAADRSVAAQDGNGVEEKDGDEGEAEGGCWSGPWGPASGVDEEDKGERPRLGLAWSTGIRGKFWRLRLKRC